MNSRKNLKAFEPMEKHFNPWRKHMTRMPFYKHQ